MTRDRIKTRIAAFHLDLLETLAGLGLGAILFVGLALRGSVTPSAFVWASALAVSLSLLYSQLRLPKTDPLQSRPVIVFVAEILMIVSLAFGLLIYFYGVNQLLVFWYPAASEADWEEAWRWSCGAVALTSLFAAIASFFRLVRRA